MALWQLQFFRRNLLIIAVTALLAAGIAFVRGCKRKETPPPPTTSTTVIVSPVVAPPPAVTATTVEAKRPTDTIAFINDKELILTPHVGMAGLKFGMTREEVERIWGAPDWTKEGTVATCYYLQHGIGLRFTPDGKLRTIIAMSRAKLSGRLRQLDPLKNFDGRTSEGIGLDTIEETVIAKYGSPDERAEVPGGGGKTNFAYRKLGLNVVLLKGKVIGMDITGE